TSFELLDLYFLIKIIFTLLSQPNMKISRNIPLDVKRKVRQRCGFGCVICGFPLYEYDHMKQWSEVKEHIADDITLLCDTHHKMVTNKMISREQISQYNFDPFTLRQGRSSTLPLYYEGKNCSISMGTSIFRALAQLCLIHSRPLSLEKKC